MAFTNGTSDDYIDLLEDLRSWLVGTAGWTQEAWTSPNVTATSVDAVVSGGSGYAVNDLITLTGGTFSVPTILRVTTVSATVITAVSIEQPGVYSVAPTDPVAQGSVSPAGGSAATFNLTYSTTVPNKYASAAVVAGGGTGYATNDIITLAGGTYGQVTKLRVTAQTGGVIDTVSIEQAGVYSVAPGNPVAQASVSPAGGSGATFTMTYRYILADVNTLSVSAPGNGPSAKVYVNIQTENDVGNGYYGWACYYATGYQAGISPGSQPGAGGPTYFNLHQFTIDYWVQANTRHFKVEAKVSTNYMSMYAGFGLPGALPSEYPFPLAVIGSYPTLTSPGFGNARNSCISDPGADGAAWYRKRTSQTNARIENQANSTSATLPKTGQRVFMWPAKTGRNNGVTGSTNIEDWAVGGIQHIKTNVSGEAVLQLCHIVDLVDQTLAMALDGVYFVTGFGFSTEQVLTYGGRSFKLFQRIGHTGDGDYFAVELV